VFASVVTNFILIVPFPFLADIIGASVVLIVNEVEVPLPGYVV